MRTLSFNDKLAVVFVGPIFFVLELWLWTIMQTSNLHPSPAMIPIASFALCFIGYEAYLEMEMKKKMTVFDILFYMLCLTMLLQTLVLTIQAVPYALAHPCYCSF